MVDLQHLRELAQKAEAIAPGPWIPDRDAGGFYVRNKPASALACVICGAGKDHEARERMMYIAAANPATILAMLDVCEAAGEVDKYNRSDRVSAATYAADAALAEALARLRGAK